MQSNAHVLAVRASEDPEAFAALYDLYYDRVYNYACYRCEDPLAAEDLTAQVFERLLTRIHTFNPQRGEFEPWLFAIARHALMDHFQSQRLRAWLPWEAMLRHPSPDALPEESVLQREQNSDLVQALGLLQERDRDLLGLKFGSRLNNRQIAQVMGLGESNVGVILYRAVERLRQALKKSEQGYVFQEVNHE